VGAAGLDSDGGYAGRVIGEQTNLRAVADGRPVPVNAPIVPPAAVPLTASDERPAAAPVAPNASSAQAGAQVALLR
jgi:hypothetical protein